MSGAPTEAEIQTQWRNGVDLLEQTRSYADTSVVGAGGILDVLMQSLEGEFTPESIASAASSFRAGLSSLVDPSRVQEFLSPMIFEYAAHLGFGGGYTNVSSLMRALYEHFDNNSLTVQSRNISFDTAATPGGSNIGNGSMSRLTVDESGYNLEACHVETKRWRCRLDQNTGIQEHAEIFEHIGDPQSIDSLDRASKGSGGQSNQVVRSRHAGPGAGGSLLRNSSFSTYSASSGFSGWDLDSGTAATQDTTNFYRSHPGATTVASMKMSADALYKQTIASMGIGKLDPNKPYMFRVMLNAQVGSAVGGSVTIRMGTVSATTTIAAIAASGWVELAIPIGTGCWFRNFNEDPFDVEIEWSGRTSGFLLIDDSIFDEWDLVDGTYWMLTGATTPWLVDDTLDFTDTGGAPSTGKIQWYLFIAGFGYLPSTTGVPTFTDP